jgi:hypothetical protein
MTIGVVKLNAWSILGNGVSAKNIPTNSAVVFFMGSPPNKPELVPTFESF